MFYRTIGSRAPLSICILIYKYLSACVCVSVYETWNWTPTHMDLTQSQHSSPFEVLFIIDCPVCFGMVKRVRTREKIITIKTTPPHAGFELISFCAERCQIHWR